MDTKILLCPLVSEDPYRSIRAIESCFLQKEYSIEYGVHVVINTKDKDFTNTIKEYCERKNIYYSITESDGTAANGKNSVFEIFSATDYSHMSQLDGDDFFYPYFLRHIQRHINKYPTTDVLATMPHDYVCKNPENHTFQLDNGLYAVTWLVNYLDWEARKLLGEDKIFLGNSMGNYARFVLFSKKISKKFRYDKSFIVGEDFKLHFEFLFAHQKDDINYWFTNAIDAWGRDTTSIGVQKKHSNTIIDGDYVTTRDEHTLERLKEFVESNMMRYRSGPGEIPVDFAPVYMSLEEKKSFLNQIF